MIPLALPSRLLSFAAPVASLCLLAGIYWDRQTFHQPPGDPEPYHARVRAAADLLPYRIGGWVGKDVEPPTSAVSLLRPNVLRGREFENAATGEHATFVFIHCRDARDLRGHSPPVCYPAHGWTMRQADPRKFSIEGLSIPASAFRFTVEAADHYSELVVYSFFVGPDGVLDDGATGVRRAAEDPRMKVFGAAQVQVIFGPTMNPDRRDEVFRTLLTAALPLLETVRGGVRR